MTRRSGSQDARRGSWTSGIGFRLRALFRRRTMERELDEELRFHLDEEARKFERRGLSVEDARRESLRRFGRVDRTKEQARGAWGVRLLDDLAIDLRYALRQLARSPLYALVAVVTLAAGVGGTAALFGVVHGLLVRPLPYADDVGLRVFWSDWNWRGNELDLVREVASAWDGIAGYTIDATTLDRDGKASLVLTGLVSAELFDVLGARPLLGRTFVEGEDRPGRELALVLSHGFWQQELGGDRNIIGQRLHLGGQPYTVIGVMPDGFYFPEPAVQAWTTLDLDPASSGYRNNGWLVLLGRVRDGVAEAGVEADLSRLATALDERFDYPEAWDKTKNPYVVPLRQYLFGSVRPSLLLLIAAAALLLVMAVANVAALLLAKMADRSTELGVRAAIGAGRMRLARQLITESLVLATLAAVAGLALAGGLFRALVGRLPLAGFEQTLSLDWPILAAALTLVPLVASLVAVAPLRHLLADPRGASLKPFLAAGGRTVSGRGQGRLQGSLVVVEVMLAVVLVVGASLLMRSVLRLYQVDTGIDTAGAIALDLIATDLDEEGRRAFFDSLIERAGSIPGVRSAALTNRLPLRDGGVQGPIKVEGRPDLDGTKRLSSLWRTVTPDYFRALRVEIIRGRAFEPTDRAGSMPVAILDSELADRLWPGEDPIGRRVATSFSGSDWLEVIGVAAPVKHTEVRGPASSVIYQPFAQTVPWDAEILILEGNADPAALIGTVRSLVRELEPRVAVGRTTTMDDVLRTELAEPLRLRFFLALFGGLALAIGAVGVYGVVSYSVSRRMREYGVRVALGAERLDLVREVLSLGGRLVGLGILAGLGLALAFSFLLTRFLFEVAPRDPVSYLIAAATLGAIGIVASILPAARASAVDPSRALRLD